MNNSTKLAFVLFTCSSLTFASGYRIPEQGFAATSKSGANIAHSLGADTSYYNPANMAFLNDKAKLEFALSYLHLTPTKYIDSQVKSLNSTAEKENFLAPIFHYVSPKVGENWRFGLSFVSPGGLAKRWESGYGKSFAKKFSLKMVEANPTFSYKINDKIAIGGGLRVVYSQGVVRSDAGGLRTRDLDGDSVDFGYNLAFSAKPTDEFTIATTYRSKVNVGLKGHAVIANGIYNGGASIDIPLPAVFDVALAYDFGNTIVEGVYERTFWSSYKALDFNYDNALIPPLATFDTPLTKNWKDSDTYRLALTHKFNDKFQMLAGFAYDKTPVDFSYAGFELPDADGKLYSVGGLYEFSNNFSLGVGYLYNVKDEFTLKQRTSANDFTHLNGTFKNTKAHILTTSIFYEF